MLKHLMLLCALCAFHPSLAVDLTGIVRREPLSNARCAFEKTGKGRVAFLGGSITQMEGWRVKVMEDLKARFPKTEFTFVNAGLSSTCSDAGAYRLDSHVFSKGVPDLIFVEYAVNDTGDGYYLRGRHDPATYERHTLRGIEGVIRRIREQDRRTDIVMTHFVSEDQLKELRAGKTPKTYAIDERVARHYNVTTVSIGAALAAAEKAGTFDWKRYGANCHPGAEGCDFILGQYRRLFDAEWSAEAPVVRNRRRIPVPGPIDSLNYSIGRFFGFGQVSLGEGWTVGPVDWTKQPGSCRDDYRNGAILAADKVGATCSFEFKGTAVGAFVLAGPDTGSLEVSIDGGTFKKYEMFSPYSRGEKGLHYPFVETFADDLAYAKHKVVLRVGAGRNAASTGNKVRIYRLCINGTDASRLIPAAYLTEPRAWTNAAGKVLLYRWAQPKKVDPAKKYPLVVLFHGAGERGSDNCAQLVHGATDLLNYMDERGVEAYFIAGQCPNGQQWVNTPWGNASHTMPTEPSEAMGLAMELIAKTLENPTVDRKQVLVTGISMGGYGTWDIVQRRPDWFAAALPCCGGGDTAQAERIKDVPIWTFHGDKDTAVPVCRSRDMTAALKAVGGNIRYREYPGVGHGCWGQTYANWNEVLAWFFSQRKK